jgi:hypothetical protein
VAEGGGGGSYKILTLFLSVVNRGPDSTGSVDPGPERKKRLTKKEK